MSTSVNSDSCRNCGASQSELLFQAGGFDQFGPQDLRKFEIRRCGGCGLVYTSDVSAAELDEAYSIDYYGSPSQKFSKIVEQVLQGLSLLRAKKIIKHWRDGSDSDGHPSVLDIGCGRGNLLTDFRSLGASTVGIERPGFEVEEANSDFIHLGSLNDCEFAGRAFDIVTIWHVLEHLEDLNGFFSLVHNHTKKDGLLLVAVPNFSSLQQKLFGANWFHLDLPRHLMHFETHWLHKNLSENDFRIESVSHFDLVQNVYGFIQSSLNLMFPARPNEYYEMLKVNKGQIRKHKLRFAIYTVITFLLTPIALAECVFSAISKQGATVQVRARVSKV